MNKWKRAAAGASTALVLLGNAWCAPASAMDAACREQMEKLCPNTKPGDGKFETCLKQNESALPKGCKDQWEEAAARANELKEFSACVADAEKLCPGVKPGAGRIIECLRTNQGNVSDACRWQLGGVTGQY
jgi:Golgi apparatus protein 1